MKAFKNKGHATGYGYSATPIKRRPLEVEPGAPRTAHTLLDAVNIGIVNDMRVGARVFRTGTPVSEVLAAATAAYQAHPSPIVEAGSAEIDAARQATKAFLHRVRTILGYDEATAPNFSMSAKDALKELLEAFMASSVADIEPEDRDTFKKRLREKLS